MALKPLTNSTDMQSSHARIRSYLMLALFAMLLLPCAAFAQGNACSDVTTYLGTFQTLLKAISIGVVTIAVIFAGYQIAFAHKRISEVAPIFIGSVLIGAAAEIASMFITTGSC